MRILHPCVHYHWGQHDCLQLIKFLQTPFWCYISVSGHPGVTSVQGGILAHYDWNFSWGWDSPDTKFQLPQRPRITYHSSNMRNFCSELTPYGPIMAGVVSRQFKAAYWLITSKLIHMSWSQILPSLVILSIFTFELHVIELFLPNSVLMQYFRRWPTWCHVSSRQHIGWLRLKL